MISGYEDFHSDMLVEGAAPKEHCYGGESKDMTGILLLFLTVSMLGCNADTIIRERPHGLNEYRETNLQAGCVHNAQVEGELCPDRV